MSESGRDETSSTTSEIRWKEIVENVPKQLTSHYLRTLHSASEQVDFRKINATDAIVSMLLATLLDERSSSELDRMLCAVILQKISPYPGMCEMLAEASVSQLVQCLPVILLQDKNDPAMKPILIKLLKYVGSLGSDPQHQVEILSFLTRIISQNDNILSSDDLKPVIDNLNQWLCRTSIFQSRRQSFSASKKQQQQQPTTELDGIPSREMFTILSCAQPLSPDQLLNIHCFSMLKAWLQKTCSTSQKDVASLSRQCSLVEDISPDLIVSIKEYCLRIIEQCNRRPQFPDDVVMQSACLSESLSLLTLICYADSSLVPSLLPIIRRVYSQYSQQMGFEPKFAEVEIVLSAVQFLLVHSSAMMHKIEDIYPFAFCDLPSQCYSNNLVSFEILALLKNNLPQLCYHTSVLEKYFPALFKILAWNPNIFSDDFVNILPSFMSQQTSVEVFHALVDLPCLTVSLMLSHMEQHPLDPEVPVPMANELMAVAKLYQSPEYQPMFNFFLRSNSGIGDTFNKIHVFLKGISSLAVHPKVLECSKAVIPLLRCYFSTLLQYSDTSLVVSLVPILFERIALLIPVEGYQQEIQSVLCDIIPTMLECHADVLVHLHKEIADYLSHIKNFSDAPRFFTCIVWAIGEFTSLSYTSLCRPEVITMYYEALECTVYEMLGSQQNELDSVKLVATLISTLAKLATRCQDLKPRVNLCLSKVHKHYTTAMSTARNPQAIRIVLERVEELMSVLQIHMASKILSPPLDIVTSKWHQDPTSLPYVLKNITNALKEHKV